MRATWIGICLGLFVAGFMPLAGLQAGEKTWTGKDIIMKRNGIKIGHTDSSGRQTYVAKLTSIQYSVLDDKGGWLKVQHGKEVGWFDKAEAVLVEDANAYFSALIRQEPNNAQYYARRGWAWYALEEHDKAISDYSQAIRISPNEVDWLSGRAVIYRSNKQYDASVRDYTKALQLNPNAAYLLHGRGWSYGLNQQYDKAFADFDAALRLEPDNSFAFNRRGIVSAKAGHYDSAIKDYNEVIRLNPDYLWGYNNRGLALSKKGEFAKAIEDFEKALKMDAREAGPRNGLAWLLATCPDSKFRDGKRAVELAKQACTLTRYKDANMLDTLAAACAEAGEFDEAVKWLEKARENAAFVKESGEDSQTRLKLYLDKKPYTAALGTDKVSPIPAIKEVARMPSAAVIGDGPLKGWKEFKSVDGGFTIPFPDTPKEHKQRVSSAVGKIDNFAYSHEGVEMTYMASFFDLPPDALLTLDKSATAYALGRKGTLLSQKSVRLGNTTGLEILVKLSDKNVSRVRLFAVGARMYQVIVDGPSDRANAEQATVFLDSFKLTALGHGMSHSRIITRLWIVLVTLPSIVFAPTG